MFYKEKCLFCEFIFYHWLWYPDRNTELQQTDAFPNIPSPTNIRATLSRSSHHSTASSRWCLRRLFIFENFLRFVWLISHKPNRYRSIPERVLFVKYLDTHLYKSPHLECSSVFQCRSIFCPISMIVVTWILKCSSHTLSIGIVFAYEHASLNCQIFRCTLTRPVLDDVLDNQITSIRGLLYFHLCLWRTWYYIMHTSHPSHLAAYGRLACKLVVL